MYFQTMYSPTSTCWHIPIPNAHSLLLNTNPLWLRLMWIDCMVSPPPSRSTFLIVGRTWVCLSIRFEKGALLSQGPRSLGQLMKGHLEGSPLGIAISPSRHQVEWTQKQCAEVLACEQSVWNQCRRYRMAWDQRDAMRCHKYRELTTCQWHELNCVSLNLYIEDLTWNVTVFGNGSCKETIKPRWGHNNEPLIW